MRARKRYASYRTSFMSASMSTDVHRFEAKVLFVNLGLHLFLLLMTADTRVAEYESGPTSWRRDGERDCVRSTAIVGLAG